MRACAVWLCGRVDTCACMHFHTRATRQHRRGRLGNGELTGLGWLRALPLGPTVLALRMICACGDATGTAGACANVPSGLSCRLQAHAGRQLSWQCLLCFTSPQP